MFSNYHLTELIKDMEWSKKEQEIDTIGFFYCPYCKCKQKMYYIKNNSYDDKYERTLYCSVCHHVKF